MHFCFQRNGLVKRRLVRYVRTAYLDWKPEGTFFLTETDEGT